MNGQEISEEFRKRSGTKPTPGTIYPALKELLEKGLVEMEQKGRAKVYTLSGQGREELEKACKYFCSAFGDIFDEYREEG